MGKKKHKKTEMQKIIKKIKKFFVNGKPMSQIVHWTVILSISGLMVIKMVEANKIIEEVQNNTALLN